MIHLTIEKIYLLKLLDCSGRRAALHDLGLNMKLIQDKELSNAGWETNTMP